MLYGEHYIEVFNQGRDTDEPLLSLYDDEGITLFFKLIMASPGVARATFQDGQIALVSFHVSQDLQTGTALYNLDTDGILETVSETGILAGLLARIDIKE